MIDIGTFSGFSAYDTCLQAKPMDSTPTLKKVFFIDDDEATNVYHKALAKEVNLATETVFYQKAQEALSVLSQLTDSNDFPELILVDINMPSIDGHEFVQKVKRLAGYDPRHSCIAMLTSSKDIKDVIEADQNEVLHYYWKPLNQDSLKEILKDGLSNRQIL